MFMRLVAVSLVALIITALGHYYIFLRVIMPLPDSFHATGAALIFVLWGLNFFGFPIARAVPYRVRQTVEFAMYFWMGAAYFLILLCLLTGPFNLYFEFFDKVQSQAALAVFVLAGSVLLITYSVYNALKPETVIKTMIPIRDNLPLSLESLKVVLLSDIHVAGLIGRRRMKRLAHKVMEQQPDLIFIGGDLVDGSVRQLRHAIAPLRELKARLGIYYVTGNHEYYCNPKRWKQFVAAEFGWNVLENAHAAIRVDEHTTINVFGIEDRQSLRTHKAELDGTFDDADAERKTTKVRKVDRRLAIATKNFDRASSRNHLNILLAHQPKDAYLLEDYPYIDLQLSGHTHGGQFWPLHVFVKSDQTYVKGLNKTGTSQHIYVSQGTGFWGPPMRFGTQCEISLLSFQRTAEGTRQ